MNRTLVKNLAFTCLHWMLVVLLGIVSFVVQYSFLIDTGEEYSSIIFSGSVYHINYVTFSIGVGLFLVGYYVLWKKYLLVDWKVFDGHLWIWKIGYILPALTAMAVVFLSGVIILFLYLGFDRDIIPEWTTWGFAAFPVYMVLVIIVEVLKKIKVNEKEK